MTPREDDASGTPPHGDPLRDRATERGSPATRHGVQLDPRGEPAEADRHPAGAAERPAKGDEERP